MKSIILTLCFLSLNVYGQQNIEWRYHPTWTIVYISGGDREMEEIDSMMDFQVPGTDCTVQKANNEMGTEPYFKRTIQCKDGAAQLLKCDAQGKEDVTCKIKMSDKKIALQLEVVRHRHLRDRAKVEAEYERNHPGTY